MPSEEKHGASNGHGGNGARRQRRSQLMQAATALPTVESSLEEFIARANSTLVDVDQWEAEARAEKERSQKILLDAEQARIHDAEEKVRNVAAQDRAMLEARIKVLQRELDDAQARGAELEAKVAVLTSSGSADTIKELEGKLAAAEKQLRTAETKLADAKAAAEKAPAALAPAAAADADAGKKIAALEERNRLAEAKVQKALAAARAASNGITVSSADLDKIEAGIGVHGSSSSFALEAPARRGMPMGAVIAAFVGGVAVMLIGVKLLGGSKQAATQQPQPPAPAAVAAPAPAPTTVSPAPAPAPVVKTEEPAPAPAPVAEVKTEEPAPAPAPVTEVKTEEPAPAPAVVKTEEPKTPKAETPKVTRTPKAETPKTPKVETPKTPKVTKPKTGIVDPFGAPEPVKAETPKVEKPKTEKPKAEKPKAEKPKTDGPGIVDPFGG